MVVGHCSGILYSTVMKFKLIQLLRSFFDNLPWYNVLPRDINYNCGKDTNFVAKLLRWKTMNYITKYFVQTILLQINWRQLNKWMNGYPDICQCFNTAIWVVVPYNASLWAILIMLMPVSFELDQVSSCYVFMIL